MDKPDTRYTYAEHGRCPYYGHSLYVVHECSRHTYEVTQSILVRNAEDQLGHVGDGVKWALNWVTKSGACAFNPVDPARLQWSKFHNAYIYKEQAEHFRFPLLIGVFYTYEDGVKRGGPRCSEIIYPLLPNH